MSQDGRTLAMILYHGTNIDFDERQLWRYRNHDIDMPTLIQNLKFMKGITFQYFFGTERAIKQLRKL